MSLSLTIFATDPVVPQDSEETEAVEAEQPEEVPGEEQETASAPVEPVINFTGAALLSQLGKLENGEKISLWKQLERI